MTDAAHGFRRLLPAFALVAVLLVQAGGTVAARGSVDFPGQSAGSRGVEVTALQHLLRAAGQQIVVTGLFGGPTQSAVGRFQQAAGLPVTGAVDGATWQQLVPDLARGSSGEQVLALQKLLGRKHDPRVPMSGVFDAATESAVKGFQDHSRLTASGAVDHATWRHLLWHFTRPDFSQPGLCNYNGGNAGADWGTGTAVGMLEAAGAIFHERTGSRIAVGDISWEHGGSIVLHATHDVGLDVDIALVRRDRNQCRRPGIDYASAQYDRDATRELIRAIYEAAPNQVMLIYFNDPELIREGLVERYPRHADHIHVRYCEVDHAHRPYRCPVPELGSGPPEPAPRDPTEIQGPVLVASRIWATRL